MRQGQSRSLGAAGTTIGVVRKGVLIVGALVLLGAAAHAAEAPRISVTEPRYDFGTVPSGSALEHVFEITNTGKALLRIEKVQPS